jgi:hypothetical protein
MILARFSHAWLGIAATLILSACSSKTAKVSDPSKTPDAGPTVTSKDGGGDSEPSPALRDGEGTADTPFIAPDGSGLISPAPDSGLDARPGDSPSGTRDGGSVDGSNDAIELADAGCTATPGASCSNVGETCSRGNGCCVCEVSYVSPTGPHWVCVERQKSGTCANVSPLPILGTSCSPATMACPFCVDGAPLCFSCAFDSLASSRASWTKAVQIASCL